MIAGGLPDSSSLVDLLHRRAAEQPDDRAYLFLTDRGAEESSLTFAELQRRALAVAAQLAARGAPGDRALLVFPPGLDFMVGFFGCLVAGIIAVPMMPPRRGAARDGSAAIVADSSPRFALTAAALMAARPDVIERYRELGMEWIVVDPADDRASMPNATPKTPGRDDVAFLQYTSGSTMEPRGVVVSHGNLMSNLEMYRRRMGLAGRATYANWVPLYHDMGLILMALQAFYIGSLCVMMAPVAFMQRPLTWLRAIHTYKVEASGGPNFAYDLCVARFRPEQMDGIDLSCWKSVIFGGEPVRRETVERFAKTFAPYGLDAKAMRVGYGLAEATVMATGGERGAGVTKRNVSRDALQRGEVRPAKDADDAQTLIGCGRGAEGCRIAIVDPSTRAREAPGRVGEVWIGGPHVTRGYWQNAAATAATFGARISGEDDAAWLRSGDLGFLDEHGELFIAGRIKDVIIIRGMNHYPQDIEDTVQDSHPALRRNGGAAFTVGDEAGNERLVVAQEVERGFHDKLAEEDFEGRIREAVTEQHEIAVHQVVLVRPGVIPKTTSGKVQRGLTRQLYLSGSLEAIA